MPGTLVVRFASERKYAQTWQAESSDRFSVKPAVMFERGIIRLASAFQALLVAGPPWLPTQG